MHRMNIEKYLSVARFLLKLNGITMKNRAAMEMDLHFQATELLSSSFPVALSMIGMSTILKIFIRWPTNCHAEPRLELA